MAKDGVDGVYSDDPKKNKTAKRYDHLTFSLAIQKKLKVMDLSALQMCLKNDIKILVFNIERPQAIIQALQRKIPTTEITK
jgi:uridylate kinase